VNLENVLLAIDALQNVPTRKWDMNSWAEFNHDHESGERLTLRDRCGTAGCALGWIASDARAMAKGLVIESNGWFGTIAIRYRGETHEQAGAKFLGVSDEVATLLFMPSGYEMPEDRYRGVVRPQNVIDRLTLLAHLGERRFLEALEGPDLSW
jgi:hypothetical protein